VKTEIFKQKYSMWDRHSYFKNLYYFWLNTLAEKGQQDRNNDYKKCLNTLFFSSSINRRSFWRRKVDNDKVITTRIYSKSKAFNPCSYEKEHCMCLLDI